MPLSTSRLHPMLAAFLLVLLASSNVFGDEAKDPAHAAKAKEGLQLFKNKVRPLLAKHCLDCHGGKSTKADFDLATRASLMDSGHVGESAADSYLMELVRHVADPAMPLKQSKLPDAAIENLARWIDLGAPYDRPLVDRAKAKGPRQVTDDDRQFWSFRRLRRIEPPRVASTAEVANNIDRFLQAKLDQAKIEPLGRADKRTLIRRGYLDALGLPPSPDAVERFLADKSDDAWPRVVDQLLKSPHYGERWARHWMDVARFAESSGYEHDSDRPTAFHYRDFLIEAFNRDLPWSQMVQWQLAGDELEPADPLALKATGFLAAGVFPTQLTESEFESARYDELDDMVGTMGVAFLGLSTGCARCHDHKFDPIPSRDYYELAAAFATTIRSEAKLDLNPAANRIELQRWRDGRAQLAGQLAQYEMKHVDGPFQDWLNQPDAWQEVPLSEWSIVRPRLVKSREGVSFRRLQDESWLAISKAPVNDEYTIRLPAPAGAAAIRLEALTHESLPRRGPGRAGNGNFALGDLKITATPEAADNASESKAAPRQIGIATARATHQQDQGDLSVKSSFDNNPNHTGWAVDRGGIGKDQAAVFVLAEPLDEAATLTLTMRFHVNGQHSLGRFRISLSDRPQAPANVGEAPRLALAAAVQAWKQGKSIENEPRKALKQWFAQRDPKYRKLWASLQAHEAAEPKPKLAGVMICSEGVKPIKHHADGRGYPHFYSQVHYLKRGDAKQKDGVAEAGFLKVLSPANAGWEEWQRKRSPSQSLSYRRAALAQWMSDHQRGAGHLLARVIVNRVWQHHFGKGIVATPNDFGLQGDAPTHPELLDWLASDLIEHDWRLKRLHRMIMTSAAYQREANVTKASVANALEKDLDNRLLWRFPARRLEAEAIRDSLLVVAGQLDETMYGPGTLDENMRRRSVYFRIKRSRPIPMMQVFDWPEHLVSIGARASTTIAPQALALMNSPRTRQYAEGFAARVWSDDAQEPEDVVRTAYAIAFSRIPTDRELRGAVSFLNTQAERYGNRGMKPAVVDLCQAFMSSNEFLYLP